MKDGDNGGEGVSFAEEDGSPDAKVGNNLFFGVFDSVLCGVPEVLCGDGKKQVGGINRTPVV